MKDLDPLVFYYVFVEMMGPWLLWSLVLAAIFGLWAFFSVVIRERGISSKRLVRSEIAGLFGGAGALVLMAHVTMSGFTDAGGEKRAADSPSCPHSLREGRASGGAGDAQAHGLVFQRSSGCGGDSAQSQCDDDIGGNAKNSFDVFRRALISLIFLDFSANL